MKEYEITESGRYLRARATAIPMAVGYAFPYGESGRMFSGPWKRGRAERWLRRQRRIAERTP